MCTWELIIQKKKAKNSYSSRKKQTFLAASYKRNTQLFCTFRASVAWSWKKTTQKTFNRRHRKALSSYDQETRRFGLNAPFTKHLQN